MIAEVMEKVGKDGVITVEESQRHQASRRSSSRACSSTAATSRPTSSPTPSAWRPSLDEPYILITDKKISAVADILPVLEKVLQVTKNFVIICRRRRRRGAGHARREQAARHDQRPRRQGARLRRPPQGDARRHRHPHRRHLHHRGHGPQARETPRSPTSAAPAASSSSKDDTTIIEGYGTDEAIQARIKQIKAQIDETASDFDREKLQERLAKLAGGVAVIKVGAATEVELKEKKLRVEDALSRHPRRRRRGHRARRRRRAPPLPARPRRRRREPRRATRRPASILLRSARGAPDPSSPRTPARKAPSSSRPSARTPRTRRTATTPCNDVYGDMLERGIIDPAKVTRSRPRERRQHRRHGADDGDAGHGHPGAAGPAALRRRRWTTRVAFSYQVAGPETRGRPTRGGLLIRVRSGTLARRRGASAPSLHEPCGSGFTSPATA